MERKQPTKREVMQQTQRAAVTNMVQMREMDEGLKGLRQLINIIIWLAGANAVVLMAIVAMLAIKA